MTLWVFIEPVVTLWVFTEPVAGDSSLFSLYSAGDGVILQHDVGQMNRLAVNINDIISATNSRPQSEVLPI